MGGPFGAGIVLGDPTGFSLKYIISQKNAVDGALAWHIGDGMHVHADYLWRFPNLIPVQSGTIVGEVGVGGRVVTDEHRKCRPHYVECEDDKDVHVGVRVPFVGVYLFASLPMDVFLELAPAVNVTPSTDADFDLGVGVRYYF